MTANTTTTKWVTRRRCVGMQIYCVVVVVVAAAVGTRKERREVFEVPKRTRIVEHSTSQCSHPTSASESCSGNSF